MSFHYLPALVADSSEPIFSDGGPSAPWKSSRTAEKSCCGASGTVCYPCSQSGTTCGPSTADRGVASWMSSLADSRASHLALQGRGSGSTTQGICGPTPSASSVRWDHDSACWRTSQTSLLTNTLDKFSQTWWRAGFASDGIASPLPPLAPFTGGTDSGSWPSPQAHDAKGARSEASALKKGSRCLARESRWPTPDAGVLTRTNRSASPNAAIRPTLALAVKWPTPTKRDRKDGTAESCANVPVNALLGRAVHGGTSTPQMSLNPDWVEWLMGWPIGWTALKPLAMARFRQWCDAHGRT